jgi:hypothetical protein
MASVKDDAVALETVGASAGLASVKIAVLKLDVGEIILLLFFAIREN